MDYLTALNSESTLTSPPPFKRAHSWPPSQWFVDRWLANPESPDFSPSKLIDDSGGDADRRPMSFDDILRERLRDIQTKIEQTDEPNESESVKAASITTAYPSNNSSRYQLSLVPITPGSQKKASYRNRHLKRWSREMTRTSKRMAKVLRLPRRNKDSSKSPEQHSDTLLEVAQRSRPRARTEICNPPHEMSLLEGEQEIPITPVPPLPVTRSRERRRSLTPITRERGRAPDTPRRDLLELNGGIRLAAGMPHLTKKRHVSGRRKASQEPKPWLQDIKEEWNLSQIARDTWAKNVIANAPRSQGRFRASSDSSVPASVLTSPY